MAKPILATPTVRGKDAERIRDALKLGQKVDPRARQLRNELLEIGLKRGGIAKRPSETIAKKYKGW